MNDVVKRVIGWGVVDDAEWQDDDPRCNRQRVQRQLCLARAEPHLDREMRWLVPEQALDPMRVWHPRREMAYQTHSVISTVSSHRCRVFCCCLSAVVGLPVNCSIEALSLTARNGARLAETVEAADQPYFAQNCKTSSPT